MILIADSGSTKTDWVSIDADGNLFFFQSKGINPTTQTELANTDIEDDLQDSIQSADAIWFYGAGIATQVTAERIKKFLRYLGARGDIFAESDLVGAGRGLCGVHDGIIGILGTGSNAGVYQDGNIVYQRPSLGYILGDEGGALDLGKAVLKAYFYETMPKESQDKFYEKYQLNKETLLSNIYQKNLGSAYISSFASFIDETPESWKNSILEQSFLSFIQSRIIPLLEIYTFPVSLIGSVAFVHQDIIRRLLTNKGIEIGQIAQKPLDGLIEYHRKTTMR